MFLVVQIGIVGDKHIVARHLFHNRMPAVLDIYDSLLVQRGAHILVAFRHIRQCRHNVQPGDGSGSPLDPFHFLGNGVPDLAEQFVFQRGQLVFRVQDRILQFL